MHPTYTVLSNAAEAASAELSVHWRPILNLVRSAVALAAFLFYAISASGACRTTPPTYYRVVTYAGSNCNSSVGGTCSPGQPVEFMVSSLGFGDPIQSCDVTTWNYGDGTTETKPAGVTTAMHSYASAGIYPITMRVTNALGTTNFFYSTPTISVGNVYFQLFD